MILHPHERARANAEADRLEARNAQLRRYEAARLDYHTALIGSDEEIAAYLEMSQALFEREQMQRKELRHG